MGSGGKEGLRFGVGRRVGGEVGGGEEGVVGWESNSSS